jgi:hypothetical protein
VLGVLAGLLFHPTGSPPNCTFRAIMKAIRSPGARTRSCARYGLPDEVSSAVLSAAA